MFDQRIISHGVMESTQISHLIINILSNYCNKVNMGLDCLNRCSDSLKFIYLAGNNPFVALHFRSSIAMMGILKREMIFFYILCASFVHLFFKLTIRSIRPTNVIVFAYKNINNKIITHNSTNPCRIRLY